MGSSGGGNRRASSRWTSRTPMPSIGLSRVCAAYTNTGRRVQVRRGRAVFFTAAFRDTHTSVASVRVHRVSTTLHRNLSSRRFAADTTVPKTRVAGAWETAFGLGHRERSWLHHSSLARPPVLPSGHHRRERVFRQTPGRGAPRGAGRKPTPCRRCSFRYALGVGSLAKELCARRWRTR